MSVIPDKVPQSLCPICGNEPMVRITPFDELFSEHKMRPGERRELVFHLAAMRARRTIEALLPSDEAGRKALEDSRK